MERFRRIPSVYWLVGITILGTGVRLYRLGAQSLWIDEAFSRWAASFPLDLSLKILIMDTVHPPLFYLLLRPVAMAGESEFILRLPAAFFGVAAIPLTYAVGRRIFGEGVGLLAAFLLSLSPMHVWYSQEARMYTMTPFWALLGMYFFSGLLEKGGSRAAPWLGLGISSALAYLTHYFTLFLPLIQFIYLLYTFRNNYHLLKKWVICQALAFAPLVPWLLAVYSQEVVSLGIGWIAPPRLLSLPLTLWGFSLSRPEQPGLLTFVGLALFALAFLNGVRLAFSEPRGPLAVLWLLLPLAVSLIISLRRPIYVDRFFTFALPAHLILVARGALGLRQKTWRLVLAGGLALGVALSLPDVYYAPAYAKEDWRAAARYIEQEERAGDALALRKQDLMVPFDYYYKGQLKREIVEGDESLAEIVAGRKRLWLVYRLLQPPVHLQVEELEEEPAVRAWLEEHRGHLRAQKLFNRVYVLFYELE